MGQKSTATEVSVSVDTRDLLADLWRRRLDTIITGIANDDPFYEQLGNAAEHISAEYQGRFLIELVQNANDQAVRARLSATEVAIIRTDSLIAIANSGQPFDSKRVESITSIFRSDKSAEECIGNKGIGFKAVFQIADSAEVYSAPHGGSLADECAIAMAMVRRPFDDGHFAEAVRRIIKTQLDVDGRRRAAIAERCDGQDPEQYVQQEAQRAAWFTFPLALTDRHLRSRIEDLSVPVESLQGMQTLIVLPTSDMSSTNARVDAAIDELIGDHGSPQLAGSSLLFLPGIGCLNVVDRVRKFSTTLTKTLACPPTSSRHGIGIKKLRLECHTQREESDPNTETDLTASNLWWVSERTLGSDTDGDGNRGERERKAIRAAIKALRLPKSNWKDVDHVLVAAALPAASELGKPYGPHGRFCIGLPTMVPTGLPIWISSHFHGQIDRTAINFENDYNSLLLGEAVSLSEALLDHLKADPDDLNRCAVVLALERTNGVLGDRLFGDGGYAQGEVVLTSQSGFVAARDLRLPKEIDLTMFNRLTAGRIDVERYGFVLPCNALMEKARSVLKCLHKYLDISDDAYLERVDSSPSLVEQAAENERASGPTFWEPFLAWIIDRFGQQFGDIVAKQSILPVGKSGLAPPESRVFFPPRPVSPEEDDEVDDEGEELAAIDPAIADLMNLFDYGAIEVRSDGGREYTTLAQRLAPVAGGGLVRRPRQADLINDALIPVMRESTNDSDRAITLLRQAVNWLATMPKKSRNRVNLDRLLVPARGRGTRWQWVSPATAYLGEGWETSRSAQLISSAYGKREASQLVNWQAFRRKAYRLFESADRGWWLDRMREIGVADAPRIVRSQRPMRVAVSNSYDFLTSTSPRCPVACPAPIWDRYIDHVCRRSAQTASGQEFYIGEVTWVEGLEDETIRTVVVEAMLRRYQQYLPDLSCRLSRHNKTDSTEPISLWAFALKTEEWDVIPTSKGRQCASAAWLPPSEDHQTKADRFAHLPCVPIEFQGARRLLQELGVATIDNAPVSRLVTALHHVSSQLEGAEPGQERHLAALSADIYEAIQRRLRDGSTSESLRAILNAPVPLFRGDDLSAANINDVDRIYINDDPVRFRHIDGPRDAWILPTRFQASCTHLVDGLNAIVGDERVCLVSRCPISVQFTELGKRIPALDYIETKFPRQDIAEDLALLIVKGGMQASSPRSDSFQRAWRRLSETVIVRGEFKSESQRSCFDGHREGGPALLVSVSLSPHQVVGECWQMIGPAYRDIWSAYAEALNAGRSDDFLAERGVSQTERTEVETVIGLAFEQQVGRFMAICLAMWRRRNSDREVDGFHREWTRHSRSANALSEWLRWDNAKQMLDVAGRREIAEASVDLLKELGISIDEWQDSRQLLGESRYRFASAEAEFRKARQRVASHLKALYAQLVVPRASEDDSQMPLDVSDGLLRAVTRMYELPVPADVAEFPLETSRAIRYAGQEAADLLKTNVAADEKSPLLRAVQALVEAPPSDLPAIKLLTEPEKSVSIYLSNDSALRAQQASDTVASVMKVATALGERHGEVIATDDIRSHPLVQLLSAGEWANRVAVLASVRHALEAAAPAVASRMKEQRAFRDFDDWRVLWRKFDELGEIPKPTAPPPPKPKFSILGTSWSEADFEESAAMGLEGELASAIQDAVENGLELSAMGKMDRDQVSNKKSNRKGGGGAGGGSRKRAPEAQLKMLGAVGEHFFYLQMKALDPDFDSTNWRSRAKEVFGYGDGDDSLGYDFEYVDARGILAGTSATPCCYIEVKSSAGEGAGAFEMSTNEWSKAIECHLGTMDANYVIVRIENTAGSPRISDVLIDPVQMRLDGYLDYSSRDLLVAVGKKTSDG